MKTETFGMFKKLSSILCLLLCLVSCVLICVSCDNGDASNKSTASESASHTHSWTEATCTSPKKCTICGTTEGKALGHDYGEWVITKAATCTQVGEKEAVCSVCGVKKVDTVKVEHDFDEGVVTSPATCEEAGEVKYTCKSCQYTKTETVAAPGHTPNSDSICTVCGKVAPYMTSSEKANAEAVRGIWEWKVWHEDKENRFVLVFSLFNNSEGRIAAPAAVDIRIINDSDKTVYEATRIVKTSDYSIRRAEVETGSADEATYQATIYIDDSEITTGDATEGDIYFTVYNSGYFAFGEVCLDIDTLPCTPEAVNSNKIAEMTHSITEQSDGVDINIALKDSKGYSVQASMNVDVKIVDDKGNIVYSETLVKTSSQSKVTIDYDDVKAGFTNTGTLYYTVYNDYAYFDMVSKELKKLPWTVTIELPDVPQTINYYSSSSCKVTGIRYSVSGSTLYFYFAGEKTYDSKGNNHSGSCKIGWKLYDSEGYVVADGTCYTNSLAVGEKFKDASDSAYSVIRQGETYRLVIMNVA